MSTRYSLTAIALLGRGAVGPANDNQHTGGLPPWSPMRRPRRLDHQLFVINVRQHR